MSEGVGVSPLGPDGTGGDGDPGEPPFLKRLLGERRTFGGWCVLPSSISAEVVARAGVDWVGVDQQHGLIGHDTLLAMLQAITLTGVPLLVRVPGHGANDITKALDSGAQGVIVPMFNDADQARAVVAACRYPPEGERSWGPIRAAGLFPGYSVAWANSRVVCAVMIETERALAAASSIAAVPGVDALYVGPADLAVSLGLAPGSPVTHPALQEALQTVAEACREQGVVAGMACPDPGSAAYAAALGFKMLGIRNDLTILGAAVRAWIASVPGAGLSEGVHTPDPPAFQLDRP